MTGNDHTTIPWLGEVRADAIANMDHNGFTLIDAKRVYALIAIADKAEWFLSCDPGDGSEYDAIQETTEAVRAAAKTP